QRRDRTGFQTTQADWLVGLLAIAIGTLLDPVEGIVDLADQLAFAVAGTQLQRAVGLQGCPVRKVGLGQTLLLQMVKRLGRFFQKLGSPRQKLLAKVLALERIHECFIFGRSVIGRKQWVHGRAVPIASLNWGASIWKLLWLA